MPDNRLRPAEWVNAGLKALAKSGFSVLKADTLANRLGISRGSFYWHFADVSAFHAAILRRWREIALENIIEELEGTADDGLGALAYRAFAGDTGIERAVRAWATADAERAIRIATRMSEENFNLQPFLPGRSLNWSSNYCAPSPSPLGALSDHGERIADALRLGAAVRMGSTPESSVMAVTVPASPDSVETNMTTSPFCRSASELLGSRFKNRCKSGPFPFPLCIVPGPRDICEPAPEGGPPIADAEAGGPVP